MAFTVDPYLGRVYRRARYDCWDMLREAWLDLTGFDLGARPPAPRAALAVWRHFDDLAVPRSPSIVFMRQRRGTSHVGLFWRGRVLHIGPEGARYERLPDASRGFERVSFHACKLSA